MTSPIKVLEEPIRECMVRIAPEREQEIRDLISKHQVVINFVDEPAFNIRTNVSVNEQTNEKRVTVPIQSLEYLWAFSLLCWVLYQEYQAAQKAGLTEFDTTSTERIKDAMAVQKWAATRISNPDACTWPAELKKPSHSCVEDVVVANELFLCALAWILHHELGHSEHGHTIAIAVRSKHEELEADSFASKIILSDLGKSDARLKKRALGVACAILALQSLEVGNKPDNNSGYPGAHERLACALQGYEVGEEGIIDAFSVAVLQLLFANTCVEADTEGEVFADILSGMLVGISRA